MQSISWEREEVQVQFGKCSRLSEVIDIIEQDCWNKGHVVCQVSLNGEILSEEDEMRLANSGVNEITSIEVKIQSVNEVLTRTKMDMEAWAGRAIDFCEKCVKCIQEGELDWVNNHFVSLADGLNWYVESLYVLKSSIRTLQKKNDIDPIWIETEKSFHSVVKEMVTAFEGQDYILLQDVLEYDLPENLNKWLELFDTEIKIEA
ncbi:MAG: hypothetical protein R2827_09440 [Bdellovibrionales bacterium]